MLKITLLALAMTAVALSGAAAAERDYEYGYIAKDVDYHTGPSPKFWELGYFEKCTEVKVYETSPGDGPKWYFVLWGEYDYGWVRATDVSYDKDYCEDYYKPAEEEREKPAEEYEDDDDDKKY